MTHDFDRLWDRHHTGSRKWAQYGPQVLPLWLADMDFAVAPAIVQALGERLQHPLLGYSVAQDELRQTLVRHMAQAYDWTIDAQDLVFLPGVEPGISMALKGLVAPGAGVVVQTPNHQPLLSSPGYWQQTPVQLPFEADGSVDPARLASATRGAGAFLLSNPHNPLGKVFERDELHAIADACVANDLLLISDEIHADILFDGRRHTPIAALGPQIARRTVTLMSASKAYNIAGLKTAFAIIQNPELRQRFNASRQGMVDSVNVLGLVATQAAYAQAGDWLQQANAYLQGNRDFLVAQLARRFPGIHLHSPQGTFLAWLDCRALELGNPQQFFLQQAKVALSDGRDFGPAGAGFVRLNFGCPRALLAEGLDRLQASLQGR